MYCKKREDKKKNKQTFILIKGNAFLLIIATPLKQIYFWMEINVLCALESYVEFIFYEPHYILLFQLKKE